jgi:ribosomal-protein-serine acetyltransferase
VLIHVRPGVELRSISEADAPELDRLIQANRSHLEPFMPWAQASDIDATRAFVRTAVRQELGDDGFHGALVCEGAIIGTAGFHRVDRINTTTSIGYWIDARHQGRGIMTATVAALIDHAFDVWDLHRIELRVAPENVRSRAIAARLRFREEGVLRGAERFGDGDYRDLIMHSLLRNDQRAWADAT